MYKYLDYTQPPFIDISLPPAIILPAYRLVAFYSFVLGIDFYLLSNEDHFKSVISTRQLRIAITIVHIVIPMVFISSNPPCNILFAAVPWFMASYSAHMPTNQLTIGKWIYTLFKVTLDNDSMHPDPVKVRYRGISKASLGVFKFVFMQIFIDPLLPHRAEYALDYPWFNAMSLMYTLLYGIKAYCLLGIIDIVMGLEQALFAWNMVDLFDSPILSYSPRDFWSRRWNRVVRNLLHKQVFTLSSQKDENYDTSDDESFIARPSTMVTKKKSPIKKTRITITTTETTTMISKRVTRSSAAAAATTLPITHQNHTISDGDNEHDVMSVTQEPRRGSFWSTKEGRGLLSFIISGIFHELIVMSACRRITLENLIFFTLQGVTVMLEVKLRQGALKQEPGEKTRALCIAIQLFHMSITGRLFLGPFLRYKFFKE